jgi:large subunit ribosomal protein L15
MAINKRKKKTRQRAATTHGWGSMKKHRGAGHRGGRGRAGSGKRGDQKKPSSWAKKKYFGKFGFKSKSRSPEVKPINIKTIEDRSETLLARGLIKLADGAYVIDLAALGYNKLLSTGNATKKMIITTAYATEKAVAKVKKAGGDVKVLVQKKKKAAKSAEKAEKPAETAQ